MDLTPLSALSMGTQRSVQAPVCQRPGLIAQILADIPQTALVQSPIRVFLNSYQLYLPGVSRAYQLTVYLLLIFN